MTGVAETQSGRPAAWELPLPSRVAGDSPSGVLDYVLLRVTGVLLAVLVLGHFAVTHFVTDVAHDDSTFVARRLSSAIWVVWDSAMLAAALAHASVGLRLAVADYASGRRRRLLQHGILVAASMLFLVGVVAIGRVAHV
jgi:succinate dehydrogenase hydrophobic anchor subunit